MKNLISTIKGSLHLFNGELNGVKDSFHISNGTNGETLEFYSDKGIKKIFDVHHYSNGHTILFKH